MFKKKRYLCLSEAEFRILIESLIHLKNKLTLQGRFTDCVDELLLKVVKTRKRLIVGTLPTSQAL